MLHNQVAHSKQVVEHSNRTECNWNKDERGHDHFGCPQALYRAV